MVRTIWRRQRIAGWASGVIGSAVVFMGIGFLIPIFLNPNQRSEVALENLPIVIVSVTGGGLLLMWISLRGRDDAFGWALEGREPDEQEQRLALRWPLREAYLSVTIWFLAGVALALFNLDHSLGFAAAVAVAIWMGGETASALVYLMLERLQRPLTAMALAARQPDTAVVPGVRARLLYTWSLGTAVPLAGLVAVGIVGATKPGVETEHVAAACVFFGAVALVVGLFATLIAARAIADPVTSVRAGLERVAAGDLSGEVPIDDASEVGQLQAGFNRMAEGLREREQIRDLFGRQVGQEVARAALAEGTRLGGEEREVGALFVDLAGSTSMALAMPPTEVVRLLNKFFRVVIEVVEDEGGFVNKFEGDATLCVFGAPAATPDPAGQALRAARELAKRLDRDMPEVGFGIGISAGTAVAGNVGSERRFEYTVVGDPVNEAARLSDLAKERGDRVLASDAALTRASEAEREEWEPGEQTVLRGRLEATRLAVPRHVPAPGPARAH